MASHRGQEPQMKDSTALLFRRQSRRREFEVARVFTASILMLAARAAGLQPAGKRPSMNRRPGGHNAKARQFGELFLALWSQQGMILRLPDYESGALTN